MINKILALSLVPWIILVVQNSITLHNSQMVLKDRNIVKENVQFSLNVGRVIHRTQIERGIMSLYVSSGSDPSLEERLHEAYRLTDLAVEGLSEWKSRSVPSHFKSKTKYHDNLRGFRNKTDIHDSNDVVNFFSADNALFVDWMVRAVKEEEKSDTWAELVAYQMLIRGKEYTGIERAIGVKFFSAGHLDLNTLLWYKGTHDKGISYLSMLQKYSTVGRGFENRYINKRTVASVNGLRNEILENKSRDFSVVSGTVWFDKMTSYINQLDDVNGAMARHITQITDEQIQEYKISLVLNIIVLVFTLIVVPIISFFIYKIAKTMDNIKQSLEEKTTELEKEQVRTETLLSQLVPSKIAKRMAVEMVVPERLPTVVVMCAEICDFDGIVERSTPNELFTIMNTVNDIVNKTSSVHGITRLEPYGNVFVFASGIQRARHQTIESKMAAMALQLVEFVRQIKMNHMTEDSVKLRIGMSSGPVMAGVVDGPLPRYRLFGPAIEEARKMAATSFPLQIQITESIQEQLSLDERFMVKLRDDDETAEMSGNQQSYWLTGDLNHHVTTVDLEISYI